MEGIKNQLDALFNSAGKHYEVLTYENFRAPDGVRKDRNGAERLILQDLLTALAPFKEKITKLNDYDI